MMRNNAKTLLVLLLLSLGAELKAQQFPQFSQYMYNGMILNPAYAGSKDYLSLTGVYRKQWADFPGAPETETFTAHGPLSEGQMGLGLVFINDKTSDASKHMDISAAYAFHIETGSGTLSLGVQGGIAQYSTDLSKLRVYDLNDNVAGLN